MTSRSGGRGRRTVNPVLDAELIQRAKAAGVLVRPDMRVGLLQHLVRARLRERLRRAAVLAAATSSTKDPQP